MTQVVLVLAVLLTATAAGLWWQRRAGRGRALPADSPRVEDGVLAELGVPAGGVTLLQFSTAFCQPCRATRRILGDVAASLAGVQHIDVDAESHLAAVRALGIVRTPTTLVLDQEGRVRNRVVGQPRRTDVLNAISPLVETPFPIDEKGGSND